MLARHISNLIDNSVEAIPLNGQISVSLTKTDESYIFEVKDNGSGIPSAILERFGELKNTSKSKGSGMGVHHAMQFVKGHGGQFCVDSDPGVGASIQMKFPLLTQKTLTIKKENTLAYLDDDPMAHVTWRDFMKNRCLSAEGFFKFEDYQEWAIRNPNHILFCDHDLKADLNGLDILEESHQRARSFLVTNSFDDAKIVARARALGIPLIPKVHLQEYQIAWV